MNISNLEAYVERKNAFNKLFGNKMLSLLNAHDRQYIADCIDGDLSPENLTCDGELRGAQVLEKSRFLNRCARELKSIDPAVTFYEFG